MTVAITALCDSEVLAAAVLYKTYILLRLWVLEYSFLQQEVSLKRTNHSQVLVLFSSENKDNLVDAASCWLGRR